MSLFNCHFLLEFSSFFDCFFFLLLFSTPPFHASQFWGDRGVCPGCSNKTKRRYIMHPEKCSHYQELVQGQIPPSTLPNPDKRSDLPCLLVFKKLSHQFRFSQTKQTKQNKHKSLFFLSSFGSRENKPNFGMFQNLPLIKPKREF